ncbi:MAG: hypothetical protein AAF564_18710 [Bacteroidota bacterium]
MARSDFNWMGVNQTFTQSNPTVTINFPIEGNAPPVDDAYLLITAHNVSHQSHRILVNNQELSGWDLPIHNPGWQTWMDRIQPGVLHTGNNTITIIRASNDDFTVKDIVVNWRE